MPKIVHVIDSLRMGGAETLVLNTVRELDGFEHVIITLNKPEDLKDKLPAGVKYYRLNFKLKWTFFSTLVRLKKILNAEKPDIIHAHLFWSIVLARLARTKKAKFIFTLHGMVGSRLFQTKGLYWFFERLTISDSQHMIAVSKTVYDDYIKYIPFKGISHVVYNYVPDEYFAHKKKDFTAGDVFRLVTVGSLRDIKNHETMVRAMRLLGPAYSLDIYGYGDMEEKLKKLAQDVNANVNFRGSQKDIYNVLPGYDLYLMASFSEGHSIALLEAMALCLPVVLSDISSFKETTQGKGIFYQVTDETQLAAKVTMMKENESLRRSVAEACHLVALQEARKEKYLANIRYLYETTDRIRGKLSASTIF